MFKRSSFSRHSLIYKFIGAAALLFSGCDEGNIVDEIFVADSESYVVKFTADVSGIDRWADGYDIALAAFDAESDYSIVQKQLRAGEDGRITLVLSGIPTSARTIELCATNKLRQRIITFESTPIAASEMSTSDTIVITLPRPVDVGMFAAIQHYIFDGTAYNCSLCHSAENGRAGLDLSAGNSHSNLVGVASTRVEGGTRVVAGDAASSVLHTALAPDNPAGLRYDHSGLLEGTLRRLIDDWIDAGAKE